MNTVYRRFLIVLLLAGLTAALVFVFLLRRQIADSFIVNRYMRENSVRRLQVGAGLNNLSGWLNSDIEPIPGQIYLDVATTFPFEDGIFQYVFGEQLIEHLSYDQAAIFLSESRRVLKPGGKIRLSTPNLEKLIRLFDSEKSPIQNTLLDYQIDRWSLPRTLSRETVVMNLFFSAWGHRFLYDPSSLTAMLREAGFVSVVQRRLGESEDADLRGIDQHWKSGGKPLDEYTSMFFEATKPD